MPYIKQLPKKKYINKNRNNRKRNKTDKEKLRIKLYNNKKWKKLRESFLIYHPLCQMCEEKGVITPTSCVHHINSPFDDGLTDEERIGRLCDPCNLMALCHHCHGLLHLHLQKDKK